MASVSIPISSPVEKDIAIHAVPISFQWDWSLPVFAKEEFLRAVGDQYGWLGGRDSAGRLLCVLPYTIVRKAGLRLVRFRTETIPVIGAFDRTAERSFLSSVVEYFRFHRADVIVPPSNNVLFRTYPDGANVAPYGSYVIDLQQTEEALWRNISKSTRSNIRTAQRDGITISECSDLDGAYELIRDTFRRSKLRFMGRESFKRLAISLGEQGKLLKAELNAVPQSYSLFAFSTPCAYWMYGGNIPHQHQGAMKLLQWEAMLQFHKLGVQKLDFFGARLYPRKGSKQEGINQMKKHLGATLAQGYIWKYSLRPFRSWIYSTSVRALRGGDLVDQEAHKLKDVVLQSAGR